MRDTATLGRSIDSIFLTISPEQLWLEAALDELGYQMTRLPAVSEAIQPKAGLWLVSEQLRPLTAAPALQIIALPLAFQPASLPKLIQQIERGLKQLQAPSEQAMSLAFEAYHEIMASFADILVLLDQHKRARYLSTAVERITGFEVSELLPKSPVEIVHPEDLQQVKAAILWSEAHPGEPVRYEYRHLCKQGGYVPLESVARNLTGVPGIDSYVIVCRDISQRAQSQELIHLSEQRYRIVAEQTGQMVYDWNVTTGQIHWAGAIERITGYDGAYYQQVDIQLWEAMIHPDDRPLVMQALQQAEASDGHFSIEYRHQHKDGSYVYVEDNGVFLMDDQGSPYRMLGSMKDVSERRKSSYAIQSALQEREILLQEIHHRVKNNFQVIISLLNLQIRKHQESSAVQLLSEARNRIRSLALVHEKLYQLEQIAEIDLADYLTLLGKELHASHHPDSARIQLELQLVTIPIQVEQAIHCGLLVNELLMNAYKYAFPDGWPAQARIRLSAQLGLAGQIILGVSDNGIGIPEPLRPALDTLKPAAGSQTLGLQLVSQLTRQLQGKLQLNVEEGSHWQLELAPRA